MKILAIICDNISLLKLGINLAVEYPTLKIIAFVFSKADLREWRQKTRKLTNFKVIMVVSSKSLIQEAKYFENSKYVLAKYQDARYAMLLYNSTYDALKDYFGKDFLANRSNIRVVVHNGYQPTAQAALDFAKQRSIPFKITEIGNVPFKMIIDNRGLNTQSCFTVSKKALDKNYLENSRRKWNQPPLRVPKKCSDKAHQVSIKYRLSKLLFPQNLHPVYQNKFRYLKSRINKIIIRILLKVCAAKTLPEYYELCILQVSNDIQLREFSNFKNIDVLRHSHEASSSTLAVKLHPAETSITDAWECIKFCREKHLYIVEDDINILIEGSSKIYLNNSSTVMKCILSNKPVVILGSSIFADRSISTVISYLEDYLVNYDLIRGGGNISDVYSRLL